MEEEWRSVVGFEGLYEVSNCGKVRSLQCGRTKTLSSNNSQTYKAVCLTKDGKKYPRTVHRLMAQAFLPVVDGKNTVDHIDRDPSNNHISNLRWADKTEQCVNRNCYSNSNQKNISRSKISGCYHVIIRRYGITYINAAFNTLEEAILARESCLIELDLGLEPVL
jgi:hypothetical protein